MFICAYTIYTFIYSYNRSYFILIICTYESDGKDYKIKQQIDNVIYVMEEKDMDATLIIMAAGIGSRFGTGIKQLA